MTQRHLRALGFSLLAAVAFAPQQVAAQGVLSGVVAAEGLVTDDQGRPIWAEFLPDGTTTREICSDPGNLSVMSAAEYAAAAAAYAAIPDPKRVLTAVEYNTTLEFKDAANNVVRKPQLNASTFTVVVRPQEAM